MRDIFEEMGSDLEKPEFDVPMIRSATSDNYLTTGMAYAWHRHQKTCYFVHSCQGNWWIPNYDVQLNNVMASHPQYRNIFGKE